MESDLSHARTMIQREQAAGSKKCIHDRILEKLTGAGNVPVMTFKRYNPIRRPITGSLYQAL